MFTQRMITMEVDCAGCAGCCIDWRAVSPDGVSLNHERRGSLVPLDDTYNLVSLSSDEVRGFVRDGFGDAMTPRLFADTDGATVGDFDLAAIDGRPAFVVGLRKPPKPVGPFGLAPEWLPTCVFLDPTTLQCRIHDNERYPGACATYPADNLALDVETECERVERAFGGDRLLDDDPGDTTPLHGSGALGATVFAHPEPERLEDTVSRLASGEPTDEDRATFLAVAAASRPGSLDVDRGRYEEMLQMVLDADSWVGCAIDAWVKEAEREVEADPALAPTVEETAGAPRTAGWD